MKYTNDKPEKESIRVVPQLTFSRNLVSLVAEENHSPFNKGDLVMQIGRSKLSEMEKPFRVRIIRTKTQDGVKIGTRIVRAQEELQPK